MPANSRQFEGETAYYNQEVALLLKVETEPAIRRLDELVDREGVDGVMIGPSDLSLSMGIPGQMKHERILELYDHVRQVCRTRKIQYGIYVSATDDWAAAIASGASWIVVGSELEFLSAAWKRVAQTKRTSAAV